MIWRNLCLYIILAIFCSMVHSKALETDKRQITPPFQSTCGYLSGDPQKPRTAGPGYHCSVDNTFGLWGYCTNTVLASVTDCGFYGRCTDAFSCTAGCGKPSGVTGISATSCAGEASICSTDILIVGADAFTYVGCGRNAGGTYYALPASVSATTTSSSGSESRATSTTISSAGISAPTATASSIADPGKPTIGAIVGGILGGIALICLTILGVFLLRRRSPSGKNAEGLSNSPAWMFEQDLDARKTTGWSTDGKTDVAAAPVEIDGAAARTLNEPVELGVSSPRMRSFS